MERSIDVSVIIPTYNRKTLLSYTLRSLDARLHPGVNVEILVVDDGSVDGTPDFVKEKFPDAILLGNQSKGAASARNTALTVANGRYIHYLDSDDLIGEGFFAAKVNFLDTNLKYNACYGAYEYFESETDDYSAIIPKYKYAANDDNEEINEHLCNYLSGNFLPCNSILWRKDILLHCGGQDEQLRINQDVDLFIRAIFHGLKIKYVNDGTSAYIRHHVLDERVGTAGENDIQKLYDILNLRQKLHGKLKEYKFTHSKYEEALSEYIFAYWRTLRHSQKQIAKEYLVFAQKVFWPVKLRGKFVFRLLGRLFGPINAVKIKYFICKRDF